MSTIEQSRREQIDQMAAQALRAGSGFVGGLFASMGVGLRGLADLRAGAPSLAAAPAVCSGTSELFARAIGENSNSAMDWLYYAAQLPSADERRYCAGRALQIDPQNEVVRAELRRMRLR